MQLAEAGRRYIYEAAFKRVTSYRRAERKARRANRGGGGGATATSTTRCVGWFMPLSQRMLRTGPLGRRRGCAGRTVGAQAEVTVPGSAGPFLTNSQLGSTMSRAPRVAASCSPGPQSSRSIWPSSPKPTTLSLPGPA